MSDTEESASERAWLRFTDGEYYHRIRSIMLEAGMGEGDVENALANVWEAGFMQGADSAKQTP